MKNKPSDAPAMLYAYLRNERGYSQFVTYNDEKSFMSALGPRLSGDPDVLEFGICRDTGLAPIVGIISNRRAVDILLRWNYVPERGDLNTTQFTRIIGKYHYHYKGVPQ